jgi:hypothetical protein
MLYVVCTFKTILVIINVHHLFSGVLDTACVYFRRHTADRMCICGEQRPLHGCNGNADFTSTNMIAHATRQFKNPDSFLAKKKPRFIGDITSNVEV